MAKVTCCKYRWKNVKTGRVYYKFTCNANGAACDDPLKPAPDAKGRTWTLDVTAPADECDLCWYEPEPKKASSAAPKKAGKVLIKRPTRKVSVRSVKRARAG